MLATNVSVSGAGEGTAGDELELMCTVTVIDHLVVNIRPFWWNRDIGTIQSWTAASGTTSVNTLTFSPLLTSHGAVYECEANIYISSPRLSQYNSDYIHVTVESKDLMTIFRAIADSSFHAQSPGQR